MPLSVHQRRWIAWIAAWAILLGALAPVVSRCLATARSAALPLLTLCVGSVDAAPLWVLKRQAQGTPGKPTLDHCALCVMHGGGHGLPPGHTRLALAAPLRHAAPTLFFIAPAPLHAWAAPLARAPPATQA